MFAKLGLDKVELETRLMHHIPSQTVIMQWETYKVR